MRTIIVPLTLLLSLLTVTSPALAAEPAPAAPPRVEALPAAPGPAPAAAAAPVPAAAVAEQKDAAAAKAERTVRIGYVDLARFSGDTASGKAAHARVQAKGDALRAKIDKKRTQLEKLKKTLETKLPEMSPKERKAKAQEFEKKVEEFQKLVKSAEDELQDLESELTRKLYGEIEQAAGAYGKANGLDAVVIKRELLYVGSGVEARDVTADVLKQMDAATGSK
jgi:outer membrane protein